MASKILYTNKEELIDDESIPLKNKVTADDMNEIKGTVNSHADDIETLDNQKADRTEIPTDLSELSNATTKFVNETQLGNEATARQNADNDLQGQINNRYTKTEIDNKFDVTNGNIATLQVDSAHRIELSINQTNYVMTATLKNKAGTVLNQSSIDLPLESVVVNGRYDNVSKKIILTLQNGNTIEIPVGDLISGLQSEITPQNKLSSDLVDDTNHTNKFVTQAEKNQIETNKNNITNLNENKENISNKVTELTSESTDIQYPSAKAVYDNESALKEKLDRYKNTIETELGDSTDTGTDLTLNGTAEYDVDLELSGNTSQATNIKTYTCVGTETGDYYFTYNNINYQFTMPTIEVNSILAFNTDTLKLYLGETEITTTTDNTGTLITLQDTPSPEYPQDIQVVKGNNEIGVKSNTRSNIIMEQNAWNFANGASYTSGSYIRTKNKIDVESGKTYTLIFDGVQPTDDNSGFVFYNNGTFVRGLKTSGLTFKVPANANQVSYNLFKAGGITPSQIYNIQLFRLEQTYPIILPTGMEMCKIGDYADEFIFQNSMWYKSKKIKKNSLINVNFGVDQKRDNTILFLGQLYEKVRGSFICNYFRHVGYATISQDIEFIGDGGGYNSRAYLSINKTRLNGYSDDLTNAQIKQLLKNYLQTIDGELYYPLITPVPEEITDTTLINQLNNIKQAYTYQGQTNISQTNEDLPFIIKADFKLSNLSRIEALESALETVSSRVDLLEE